MSTLNTQLLRLSVAIVFGDWGLLRKLRRGAEPDRTWREAVLQTHLFAGIPRQIEAFRVLEEEGGLGQLEPEELAPIQPEQTRFEVGFEFFQTIYGRHTPQVRAMLEKQHPDWARWVIGHAYGRVLTRPGLSAAQRELLAVVCLAALDQAHQLKSHAIGALRTGACLEELTAAVDAVADLLNPQALGRARQVLDSIDVDGSGA